jgi:starch synthase/alpha-amylase
MIGPIYGSLPVAHDTGGIHDTITHLDVDRNTGNGFLFKDFDTNGLFWAINQAIEFYMLPAEIKKTQIERIMNASTASYNHAVTASQYIKLYEKMLERPLLVEDSEKK